MVGGYASGSVGVGISGADTVAKVAGRRHVVTTTITVLRPSRGRRCGLRRCRPHLVCPFDRSKIFAFRRRAMTRLLAMLTLSFSVPASAQVVQPSNAAALASTCPYGVILNDGCTGAQAHGVKPYPHLADYQRVIMVNVIGGSGYTNGTGYSWISSGGGCLTNATGTVDVVGGALTNGQVTNEGEGCTSRPTISVPAGTTGGSGARIVATVYRLTPHNANPTYNLPGIDFPIGYDNSLTLKDPTDGSSLPPCASYENNLVTIVSNSCTLNGFDFSLHNTNLKINGNLVGALVTNNKFIANANARNGSIVIASGSCDATIKYNQLDGAAVPVSGSGYEMVASINSSCYSGQITVEYNYIFDFDSKGLNLGGANGITAATLAVTENYNMYSQIALCATGCSHGEAEYSYSGYTNGPVYETINPWIQKFNVAFTFYSNRGGSPTSQMAIEADAVNIKNADFEYNFVLNPGPWSAIGSNNGTHSPVTASAPIYCGYQENGNNSSGIMRNNLLDYTGAYFPYNPSGGTCTTAFPSVSDLNAVTGHPCNPRKCN